MTRCTPYNIMWQSLSVTCGRPWLKIFPELFRLNPLTFWNFKWTLFKWKGVMVFNATFNNISAILWRSVLLVEDIGDSESRKSLTNFIALCCTPLHDRDSNSKHQWWLALIAGTTVCTNMSSKARQWYLIYITWRLSHFI
jgi:hypothetical protein